MSDEIPAYPPGVLLYSGGGGDWQTNYIALGVQTEDKEWEVKYYYLWKGSNGLASYWQEHNIAHVMGAICNDLMNERLQSLVAEGVEQ